MVDSAIDPEIQTPTRASFFVPCEVVVGDSGDSEAIRISGEPRPNKAMEVTALAGLRRSLSLFFPNISPSLPPERFFREVLAAAAWHDHDLIRDLVSEVDPRGRILGMDFTE